MLTNVDTCRVNTRIFSRRVNFKEIAEQKLMNQLECRLKSGQQWCYREIQTDIGPIIEKNMIKSDIMAKMWVQ